MQRISSVPNSKLSLDMYRDKWLEDMKLPVTSKLAETVGKYRSVSNPFYENTFTKRKLMQLFGILLKGYTR